MRHLTRLIASVFYIGYIPFASGTAGSAAALLAYYFLKDNTPLMGVVIFVSISLGIATAGNPLVFKAKDAGEIVIDEFSGMLLSLYLLPPRTAYVVTAFLLFRFFDIVKPFPVRNLEKLKGSLGIMADDLMAAVYANLILQIVHRVL